MSINYSSQPSYIQSLMTWADGARSWTGNAGSPATFSYSFIPSLKYKNPATLDVDWNGGSINLQYGIDTNADSIPDDFDISSAQQAAVTTAFGIWDNYANISYGSPVTTGGADIVFYLATAPGGSDPGAAAWSDKTSTTLNNVDIALTQHAGSPTVGDYGFELIMHEIGHALGINHPNNNPNALDRDVSIMSYTADTAPGGVVGVAANAVTPMIYDVAAIQFLYGANYAYNSNTSTYTLDNTNKVETIWDGGNTDIITAAGESLDAVIDLRGGIDPLTGNPRWSHVGNHYMSIAFDPAEFSGASIISGKDGVVDIENATGGSGDDSIYGNDLSNELIGGAGNDTLYGYNGDDTINGGANDDTIYGGNGADTLIGGAGNDHIYSEETGDTIGSIEHFIYQAGDGFDTLEGGLKLDVYDFQMDEADFDGSSEDLAIIIDSDNRFEITTDTGYSAIEPLLAYQELYFAGVNFTANSGIVIMDNVNVGSHVADLVNDDLMIAFGELDYGNLWDGLSQLDNYKIIVMKDVGAGLHYTGSLYNYLFKNGLLKFSGANAGDIKVNIGIVANGTSGADTLNLNETSNVAFGDTGGDTFSAGLGAAGYNALIEDYTYAQGDVIDITAFDGAVNDLSDLNITQGNGTSLLTLPNAGGDISLALNGVTASSIDATYFLSNTLDYGTGSTYNGTSGVDTIIGSQANDTINGGNGADALLGWMGNDEIHGGSGNDTITGGYGADTIYGDDGDDYLAGEGGNDLIIGGNGSDYIDGGAGIDTASYITSSAFVSIDLSINSHWSGEASWDNFISVENVIGSAYGDNIIGGSGVNEIYGGNGADGIYGGDGADFLAGQGDADWIVGDGGADTLIGGAGSDGLTGGTGNDVFRFNSASESVLWGGDWIYDFSQGNDKIDLTGISGSISVIGTSVFSGAGNELRQYSASGNTVLDIDLDGDTATDVQIVLVGTYTFVQGDLVS